MRWWLVLAGGALGSGARYLTVTVTAGWLGTQFPWGTLGVNIAGSFLIGLIATLADEGGAIGPQARAFLIVGILGGFTTFSSFSLETVRLTEDRALLQAAGYVALSLALGLGATVLGIALGRAVE